MAITLQTLIKGIKGLVNKYQGGWAGAIGKVVARKFVTHPFRLA